MSTGAQPRETGRDLFLGSVVQMQTNFDVITTLHGPILQNSVADTLKQQICIKKKKKSNNKANRCRVARGTFLGFVTAMSVEAFVKKKILSLCSSAILGVVDKENKFFSLSTTP